MLEQVVEMARGVYTVPVHVTDLQNKGGVQVLSLRVCQCLGGECVAKRSSVSVGIDLGRPSHAAGLPAAPTAL